MANSYLNELPPWPNNRPVPAEALHLLYAEGKEWRLPASRVGGAAGGVVNTPLVKEDLTDLKEYAAIGPGESPRVFLGQYVSVKHYAERGAYDPDTDRSFADLRFVENSNGKYVGWGNDSKTFPFGLDAVRVSGTPGQIVDSYSKLDITKPVKKGDKISWDEIDGENRLYEAREDQLNTPVTPPTGAGDDALWYAYAPLSAPVESYQPQTELTHADLLLAVQAGKLIAGQSIRVTARQLMGQQLPDVVITALSGLEIGQEEAYLVGGGLPVPVVYNVYDDTTITREQHLLQLLRNYTTTGDLSQFEKIVTASTLQGAIRTALLGSLGTGARYLFVATTPQKYATQANGLVGSLVQPFRSIQEASYWALRGDVIFVLPGGDAMYKGELVYSQVFYLQVDVTIQAIGTVNITGYSETGYNVGSPAAKVCYRGLTFWDIQHSIITPRNGINHDVEYIDVNWRGNTVLHIQQAVEGAPTKLPLLLRNRAYGRTNAELPVIRLAAVPRGGLGLFPVLEDCVLDTPGSVFDSWKPNDEDTYYRTGIKGKLRGTTTFRAGGPLLVTGTNDAGQAVTLADLFDDERYQSGPNGPGGLPPADSVTEAMLAPAVRTKLNATGGNVEQMAFCQVAFSAVIAGNQAIPATAFSQLTFNTVEIDIGGGWDAQNNRYVVPPGQGGIYECTLSPRLADNWYPGTSFGFGVDKALVDSARFNWRVSANTTSGDARNGAASAPIPYTLAAGDTLYAFAFTQQPGSFVFLNLIIKRIR